MMELDDYTLKEITDYLIDEIAKEKGISKKLARKLFINALNIRWVFDIICDGVNELLEEEES